MFADATKKLLDCTYEKLKISAAYSSKPTGLSRSEKLLSSPGDAESL